jgi:hypothetical protein
MPVLYEPAAPASVRNSRYLLPIRAAGKRDPDLTVGARCRFFPVPGSPFPLFID